VTVTLNEVITPREVLLVALLARGYTTDRAARELNLSRHTVGEVISVLLERFDCSNRAALVAYFYVHRLLPLGVWPPPCGLPDKHAPHEPTLPATGPHWAGATPNT
jgi:DNA-binding CsgD family transcriptional regulator